MCVCVYVYIYIYIERERERERERELSWQLCVGLSVGDIGSTSPIYLHLRISTSRVMILDWKHYNFKQNT